MRLYLHPLSERLWHWIQALIIMGLLLTGAVIHWSDYSHLPYSFTVQLHNLLGILLICSFFFWLFYGALSGRITHYHFSRDELYPGIPRQLKYYVWDIFWGREHPIHPTLTNKFNPLQKLTYAMTMFLLMPLMCTSGLLYLYPLRFGTLISHIGGLHMLALLHFFLATIFAAFLVVHLYLTTTGPTITAEISSMITGYLSDVAPPRSAAPRRPAAHGRITTPRR